MPASPFHVPHVLKVRDTPCHWQRKINPIKAWRIHSSYLNRFAWRKVFYYLHRRRYTIYMVVLDQISIPSDGNLHTAKESLAYTGRLLGKTSTRYPGRERGSPKPPPLCHISNFAPQIYTSITSFIVSLLARHNLSCLEFFIVNIHTLNPQCCHSFLRSSKYRVGTLISVFGSMRS